MSIRIPTVRLVTATLCALLLTSMAPPGGAAAAELFLLGRSGRHYVVAVRCTDSGCVRASRLYALRGRDPWLVMPWRLPS